MVKASVRNILRDIESLGEKERLVLEREWAARIEAEWVRESRRARTQARKLGIDQEAIDRAVERRRYGR